MTEIPEHLLKRSRERRAALGLGGGEAPESTSGEAAAATPSAPAPAPAPATPAAPAEPAPPEPPKPDPVYIQAAKRRKRIPYWAMTALAALPVWGYVYVRTLEPPPEEDTDPLALGAQVYSANCASCHGGSGEGGSGPAFVDGAVVATWPDYRDHLAWVMLGSDGWPSSTYGADESPKKGGMPPFGNQLDEQQLAQVVLHERMLAGEDVSEENPDYADLFAIANGEMTLAEAGLGELSEQDGVTEADLGG